MHPLSPSVTRVSTIEVNFLRGSMTKQLQATLAAILVISAISVPAQTTTATPTSASSKSKKKHVAAKAPRESATERQIRELREQMQNQQAEIDSLKSQGAAKDAALAAAQQTATNAETVAAAATTQAQTVNTTVQANVDAVASLQGTVTDLKNSNTGLALTISDTKKDLTEKIENPTEVHYKGVTIKPVGFVAAETVYRSRSINSDVNTPFSATPYMGTARTGLHQRVQCQRSSVAYRNLCHRSHRVGQDGRLLRVRLPLRRYNLQRQPDQQLHRSSARDVGPGRAQEGLHLHRRPDVVDGDRTQEGYRRGSG